MGDEKNQRPKVPPNKKWFTLREVALILGVDDGTVRYWKKKGWFTPDHVDHDGKFYYTREQIEQLVSVYRKDWRNLFTFKDVEDLQAIPQVAQNGSECGKDTDEKEYKSRNEEIMSETSSETALMIQKIVPSALRNVPRWVLHKSKVPYIFKKSASKIIMHKIDPTQIGNKLLTYDEAVTGLQNCGGNADGLGFVLDKKTVPAVCIDIDGKDNNYATRFLSELKDTYIEISPSGNGFHIWYIDRETDDISGRRTKGLEIYAAKRFITFTGNRVEGCNSELKVFNGLTRRLILELFDNTQADQALDADIEGISFDEPPAVSDDEVRRAIENSNDFIIKRLLLDGDSSKYPSVSEADWHCILKLCFWTGGNAGQIERLFNQSPLGKRDKWQGREDYRRRTILRAIAAWDGNSYGGNNFKDNPRMIHVKHGDNCIFTNADGKEIVFQTPRGYSVVIGKGIFKTGEVDNEADKCICNDVILPLRTFRNADSQAVSVDLWFYRKDRWQHSVFPNDIISVNSEIVALSNIGLDVTSINARALVAFFRSFKNVNADLIEETTAYSQTGWRGTSEFIYPIETPEYIIDADSDTDFPSLFEPKGDRDSWLYVYNQFKQHKYFRLAVAASLAAPLLKVLRLRNMTLQFWSQSGSGKTAILKFADSVYKSHLPMLNFRATNNFIELRCVTLSDFPICIDELKTADCDKKIKNGVDLFAHLIENGISKGRATKAIKQRDIKTFRTIAIITGEHPLTELNSDMGIKRRTLEIHCDSIFPKNLTFQEQSAAAFLHVFVEDNYGLVGQEWIDLIKKTSIQDEIVDKYKEVRQHLRERRPDAFEEHCNLLAACATADFFFNQNIAEEGVTPDISALLGTETDFNVELEESDYVRAFKFIADWVEQNRGFFIVEGTPLKQQRAVKYGWIVDKGKVDESIAIISGVLHDVLKEAGFNPRKALTELVQKNFIEFQVQADGKKSFSVVRRIKNEGAKRVILIPMQNFIDKLQ